MSSIGLAPGDLGRLRVARSPLLEAALSFRMVLGYGAAAEHASWVARARRRLAGCDLGALAVLFRPHDTADLLGQAPATARPSLDAELHRLCLTPEELVHGDIRRLWNTDLPAAARLYLADPRSALLRLADAVRLYWDRVLAPMWPRLDAVLERDLSYRSQQMLAGGVSVMLAALPPQIRVGPDSIRVGACADRFASSGNGVVFLPSVFATSRPVTASQQWPTPPVIYRAHGFGSVHDNASSAPNAALALVLSPRRAALVRALTAPMTTGQLARLLGVTPSAVSQQMRPLCDSGLVRRTALGRHAYFQLTGDGLELVRAMGLS